MNRYEAYCTEDFVLDREFQNWVRYKAAANASFWDNYLVQNPGQESDIGQARILLEGIYSKYKTNISEDEIESEISGLINRIREDKAQALSISEPENNQWFFIGQSGVWFAAAAVLVILGFAGWYGLKSLSGPSYARMIEGKSLIEKINNTKDKQTIHFQDGSIAVLEPNSRLNIPSDFTSDKREVYLSGEAYFKITKDINRPFLVYTNKLVTRVLGTSFIVKALKDANEITVEVKEGKVSVFRKDDFEKVTSGTKNESKGIVVTPNQRIVFEGDGTRMVKTLSAVPEIISNTKAVPQFDYKDKPVREVLEELKNAYQVDIIFDADLLSDCPITANLSNLSLIKKLNTICEAIEAKYEVLDGKIIIYGKSCLN